MVEARNSHEKVLRTEFGSAGRCRTPVSRVRLLGALGLRALLLSREGSLALALALLYFLASCKHWCARIEQASLPSPSRGPPRRWVRTGVLLDRGDRHDKSQTQDDIRVLEWCSDTGLG